MSILIKIDNQVHDISAFDKPKGLIVLFDRDNDKCLLTINAAPVLLTDYITENVHPMQLAPDIQFNEELGEVVQVIHTRALVRIVKNYRHTEHAVKVIPIQNKKMTFENTIKVDMGILASAMRKED